MIDQRTVLGVIPARGGSKRIPRKNLHPVLGKPLIAWTIEETKQSKYLDRVILSSEDPEIIAVANAWGCEVPFVRPIELSQDETAGVAPVLHAINELPDYDIVVLLQPTSPLRTVGDIDRCLEHFISNQADVCVSITKVQQTPYWMYMLDTRGVIQPFTPSIPSGIQQQGPSPIYVLNGAIYVADCNYLRAKRTFVDATTLGFVMPPERSVDIDTEIDLRLATVILEGKL